jgi:hypothetical protein
MIIPAINAVCSYAFTQNFASLNGIYTLEDVTSFNEAVANGVNFIADLYTPAGLAASQFTTDAPTYVKDAVLHLLPKNSTQVPLFVPASVLNSIPDPMVSCYNNLAIGIQLGLFEDPDQLTWVIAELNQLLGSAVGTTSGPVTLFSLGTEFLRVVDFDTRQAEREASRQAAPTLYQQLQQQIALTKAAQTLNRYYVATLLALNTPMT